MKKKIKELVKAKILIKNDGSLVFQDLPEEMLEVGGILAGKDKSFIKKLWKKVGKK